MTPRFASPLRAAALVALAAAALAGLGLAGALPAPEAAPSGPEAGKAEAGKAVAGDPEAGAAAFERRCAACHVIRDEATGALLAGRAGRTGPNLHGVAGRVAGSRPGFAYSRSLQALGAAGATWEEATLVPYVQDPTGFLRAALGDPGARGRMAFRVGDAQEARDLWAYLAGLPGAGPAP